MLPRFNRKGTRADKYCYVKLDIDEPWPRLSIVKNPAKKGIHLGPLPSRSMARLVVDALHDRCTAAALHRAAGTELRRSRRMRLCAAQHSSESRTVHVLGTADAAEYARDVEVARRAMTGDPGIIVGRLHDTMRSLATQQRFEEAAAVAIGSKRCWAQ